MRSAQNEMKAVVMELLFRKEKKNRKVENTSAKRLKLVSEGAGKRRLEWILRVGFGLKSEYAK